MSDYTELCAYLRRIGTASGKEAAAAISSLQRDLAARDATIAELQAQLPEGMKHCTIRFKECDIGHGWLTATNWTQHECPWCERDAAQRKVEELRGLLREVVEVVAACHNCLSYEAPELADRVDAALGEKP